MTGIYLLTPLIFEVIDNLKPSWRNELEITDALDNLLKQNDNISYETITDYWKDTGTPEDILNANRQVLEHICKQTGGHSSIIGKNCKIDESVSIGPNVSIGDDTIISSNVVIENSIIMSGCLLYTSPSPRDGLLSRMPSSA